MNDRIILASNRGDMGGGEVMLLHLAEALRDLGTDAVVVSPEHPSELRERAEQRGFAVEVISATDRRSYLLNLRAWDRTSRDGLLWCNGLLPAVATTGHRRRLVHLHQRPTARQRPLALTARRGALATFVPSWSMAEHLPGSAVLPNFVPPLDTVHEPSDDFRVGFLGRLSRDKGMDVLVEAMEILDLRLGDRCRLIVGGESRFVSNNEATELQRRIEALRMPVDWLGWVAPDEFFGKTDVLVVPSTWQEPFGLVTAEAMAAGVPVIVSDAGALPEVVGPDHPWIVPAGEAQALARALYDVATADADRIERTVRAARDRWAERFSPTAGRQHIRALLTSIGLPVRTLERGASS
ncbi:glycosyltransferase family 4 protein [Kocuria sp. M1R5S2]|uniref:glycosyltransferase family 4 protein n=1 Tax=Kocuria rhizosphaerae TaxID=3376285 RepID=UPI00379C0C9A